MNDEELVAALVERLFESREDAKHVAHCWMCDPSDEGGFYRCPENPVAIQEKLERDAKKFGDLMVWIARGCPPQTETEKAQRAIAKVLMDSYRAQVEHACRIEAMFFGNASAARS